MSISFSIKSKSQSDRLKKPTAASFSSGAAKSDCSAINYVSEFCGDEAPESKIKTIAPLPNAWRSNPGLQFELDAGTNPEAADISMGFGLNLRQPSATTLGQGETILDLELRRLKEILENLPEDPGFDEYDDVPVEGFGAALLSGYGWKEGRGIGRNAKEDVKVSEVISKTGRRGKIMSIIQSSYLTLRMEMQKAGGVLLFIV